MKRILNISLMIPFLFLASCDLDLYPVTSYNEGNVTVTEDTESQYTTREQMKGLRDGIYSSNLKGDLIQRCAYMDRLVYTECRSDNAYAGTNSAELVTAEANNIDPENVNVVRDWSDYLTQVSNANQIICNIDAVAEMDPALTEQEHSQWKAEALVLRSWYLYMMVQLWGDVPMVLVIPPAITSENVETVYEEYFPGRTPVEDVYAQIIGDLEYATEYAPDPNVGEGGDKFLLSKAFAEGLLARIYAENTVYQDWNKVAQYCQKVEAWGFTLCDDYGEMWSYNDDDATRNTSESIFEVTYSRASGNWVNWMFYRDAYNPSGSYTWAKWVTPSRDLIAAYDAAGDTERKAACIAFDECTWSNYYPNYEYAFMNKVPTGASSLIFMRLGEIYLLHAEALARQNILTGDGSAEDYVNRIRTRAGLGGLTPSQTSSQEVMLDAILNERRLELAFEGFRFFDLVRFGRISEVDDLYLTDSYWQTRSPMTEDTILLPVSALAISQNTNLTQNPGY